MIHILGRLDLVFLLTLAALLPSIAIMMTSFLRIIIILSFTRNALGIQQTPPNMALTGIALFLTLYIMSPVIGRINTEAYQPYVQGEITQEEAFDRMVVPVKEFMLRNTEADTLEAIFAADEAAVPAGNADDLRVFDVVIRIQADGADDRIQRRAVAAAR